MLNSILSFIPQIDYCLAAFTTGAFCRLVLMLMDCYVFNPFSNSKTQLLSSSVLTLIGFSLGVFMSGRYISGHSFAIVLARFVSVMVVFFAFIFVGGFLAEWCAKRFIFRG